MCIKETIERLKQEAGKCELKLKILQHNLYLAESDIQNHIYESLETAEGVLYDLLSSRAGDACEGSYCFGEDKYTQDFIVDGKEYTATMSFEYGRHDKTYYYIDGSDFSYKEKH